MEVAEAVGGSVDPGGFVGLLDPVVGGEGVEGVAAGFAAVAGVGGEASGVDLDAVADGLE